MAIIDVISYNGEKEVFDLRYNLLKDFVDEFIVVEAEHTFSGNPKPLYFLEIKDKYPEVKYHVIDENYSEDEVKFAFNSPSTAGQDSWTREFLQKESIKKALVHLKDEDIIYISDCDEVWKPKEIGDGIYKLRQLMYVYYLNNRTSEQWAGTFVTRYKNIKNGCLNYMRQMPPEGTIDFDRLKDRKFLDDGGWHFSSMGGVDELKRKIESYGHQELNRQDIKDSLSFRIMNNQDFIGRDFKLWVDESDWPPWLVINRSKFAHLLR